MMVVAGVAAVVSAGEWYVDPVAGNDDYDGTASNVVSATVGPRRTLAGIMQKVSANDTIWLMPGEYADGVMDMTSDNDGPRRLNVANKPGLRFRAVGNRDNTVIVGGSGVGCVRVSNNSANVVFEGITFRDGQAKLGAGLRDHSKTCWVISCRFENCVASSNGGAMVQGLAAATEFVDCACTAANSPQIWYCGTYAEFCGFRNNRALVGPAFTQGGTFVNCTIVGCNVVVFNNSTEFRLYNSLVFGNVTSSGADNGASAAGTLSAWNSWFGACSKTLGTVNEATQTGVSADRARLVACAAGDFRLANTSEALALGDAAWLSSATMPAGISQTFPAGFTRRDLYGHPVPATSGAIAAGCSIADFPAQTHGCILFNNNMQVREFGDRIFRVGDSITPVGDNYAFALKPVVASGQMPPQYLQDTAYREASRNFFFPMRDGYFPVSAMPELDATRKISLYLATQVVYADASNGNDDWDGTASNHVSGVVGPKKTLAGAVSAVVDGRRATILALPGVYDDGTDGVYANKKAPRDPTMNGVRYRVHVESTSAGSYQTCVSLVAVEGPEKTFIVGAPDPATGGTGPEAIGGVWFESGNHSLQGFTLTGCYGPSDVSKWPQRGAAFNGGGSISTHALDCIISNNVAERASAAGYGTLFRCRIYDNRSALYTCENSELGACLIAGNVHANASSVSGDHATVCAGAACGCTFDGEDAENAWPIFRNTPSVGAMLVVRYGGEGLDGVCRDMIPLVADVDARDYRLGSLSAARGRTAIGDLCRATRFLFQYDIDGNPVEIIDGRLTFGALQDATKMPASFAVFGVNGGVAGGARTNLVDVAEETTVSALTTRPFLHLEVDGVAQPEGQLSVTLTPRAEPGAVTVVKAVYGTNWYVNVAAADDQAPGSTPETARRTIRSVAANAIAGDVIHVARGLYGETEGTTSPAAGSVLPCRVALPLGVTLEATDGPDETFIVGAADTSGDAVNGNGPAAVRAVHCAGNNVIRGFTITGGHTYQTVPQGGKQADCLGGAIFSENASSRYIDCVISNNAAREGTIYRGKVIRCRVLGNFGTIPLNAEGNPNASGSAGELCDWYGCVVDGNCGNATLLNAGRIEFCTIGSGNYCYDKNGERGSQVVFSTSPYRMFNSVIYGTKNSTYGSKLYATNCLFRTGLTTIGWNQEPYSSNRGHCIFTNDANITVDADYMPVLGEFAGIDQGDLSLSDGTLFTDTDINGGQRIRNGRIDIGAVEYDWRPNYAAVLDRRATVTAASPSVVLDANAAITLTDGCELVFSMSEQMGRTVKCSLPVTLSGTGVFRVKNAEGTVLGELTASGKVVIPVTGPSTGFVLEYAGEGSAFLAALERNVGLCVNFR
ncbi:MAG: DUF1565 domain-containing protein [Kiritimatiellae bacterium]|nr:DUF1565 domain-containing protein [Kiritimatiellia bacterium]